MPRNKAVLVGINDYLNFPDQSLEGCENDVQDLSDLLVNMFQFDSRDITILENDRATKEQIDQAMKTLLASTGEGDRLLFHFSGHGTYSTPDGEPPTNIVDGLVVDGIICPHDFNFGDPDINFISDAELRDWTKRLPSGAELVVILDSCHSGSGTREIHPAGKPAFFIDDNVTRRQIELKANKYGTSEEKKRLLEAKIPPRDTQKRPRSLKPPKASTQQFTAKRSILRPRDDTSTMNHILLAACTIGEVAGDASFNGRPNGVFTHYLCATLNKTTASLDRSELQNLVIKAINDNQWDQHPRFEARSLDEPLFSDDTTPQGYPMGNSKPKTAAPSPSQPTPSTQQVDDDSQRRRRLLQDLQGRRLEDAYLRDDIRTDIQTEAQSATHDPDALLDPGSVQLLEQIIAAKRHQDRSLTQASKNPSRALVGSRLLNSATVVIVPGFLSSQLSDKAANGHGLIWVNPVLDPLSDRLSYLRLGPLGSDLSETDADQTVQILSDGPLPLLFDLLRGALETALFGPRYWTNVCAFDWRRNLDDAANSLILFMRSLKTQAPSWPIHLIAHSQGALVARKALQLLGSNSDLVEQLVLLGPANYGSMAAVRGLGNEVTELDFVRKFAVEPPLGYNSVLSTWSGLYQLIPSKTDRVPWLVKNNVFDPAFWGSFPIDPARLNQFKKWAESIDTDFFNDQTTIIIGDNKGQPTVGGVVITNGVMQIDGQNGLVGDGTVTHSCAVLPGVTTYLAEGTEHSLLPTYPSVIKAVQQILAGNTPSLPTVSSNPGDYTTPLQMDVRSLRPRPRAAVSASRALQHGETDGGAFEQLVTTVARVANRTGTRIRIGIDIDSPSER